MVFSLFLVTIYPSGSSALFNINIKEYLNDREIKWPNWNVPNLTNSDINKDLIYPEWFEGDWLVSSEDLTNSSEKKVIYKVNFLKNQFGEIVGNRSKNSESIGKAIFGDQLQKVKNDPLSFNNQIIYLSNNEYIESRVTQRNQILDDNLFFSDEFVIQTNHMRGISRINQVEIMSKFYKCDQAMKVNSNLHPDICGTQYTATYGSKVGNPSIQAITTNKYNLIFKFIEN